MTGTYQPPREPRDRSRSDAAKRRTLERRQERARKIALVTL